MIHIFLILAFVLQPIAGLGVGVRSESAGKTNHQTGLTVVDSSMMTSSSSCCAVKVKVIEPEPSGCCKTQPVVPAAAPTCGCDMNRVPTHEGMPISQGFPVECPGQLRSIELLTFLQRSTFMADVDPEQDSLRRGRFSEFDGRRIAALTQRQAHARLCVWQT